jgi:hypothetical protein
MLRTMETRLSGAEGASDDGKTEDVGRWRQLWETRRIKPLTGSQSEGRNGHYAYAIAPVLLRERLAPVSG